MTLESAISDLQRTLSANRTASSWRLMTRQQLAAVRDALNDERFATWDGWLAAGLMATLGFQSIAPAAGSCHWRWQLTPERWAASLRSTPRAK